MGNTIMGRFLRILGAALGVIIVLGLLFLWLWDFSRYEPEIEAAISDSIGREFRIDGNFEVEILPRPTVLVEGATLANAAWSDEPNMVRVGRAYVEVGLWSLLFRPVEVRRLELSDIDVLLESNSEGEANWQLGAPDEESETEVEEGDAEIPVKVISADISDVRFAYRQDDTDAIELLLKSLVAADSDPTGSLDFDASFGSVTEIGKRFGVNNLPGDDLVMAGNLALRGGALAITDFRASLTGMEITIDGEIGGDAVTLAFAANGDRLSVFDAGLPDIPYGFSSDVSMVGTTIDVVPIDLSFGESKLTGELHYTGGDTPTVSANMNSPSVDLRPFMPEEETDESSEDDTDEAESPYVFGEEPLPLDALNSMNADVSVSIGELLIRNTQVNNFDFKVDLTNGLLNVDNTFDGKYQGQYRNDIRLQSSGNNASLRLDMVVKGLKLGMLSGSEIPVEQISATNVDVGLDAMGASPRALAASMNGKIVVTQGPGRTKNSIIGNLTGDIIAQLFTALNPFAEEEEFTNWECSVFGIDFVGGVGTINGFLLQSEKLMIVGGGEVDLNTEKLDFEFNTKPRAGVGVSADMFVTPFVKLTGTLADPSVGLNAKGVLLSGGAAVLTGGMSFLYKGLIDRASAEEGKCDEALQSAGTVMHQSDTD
jgi:AsmA protein